MTDRANREPGDGIRGSERPPGGSHDHWLVRPATIRRLWVGFCIVLALTVLAQLAIGIKGHFGVDGWFGFAAGFGFLSCVAMVLIAKGLGALLKRPEDYYGD